MRSFRDSFCGNLEMEEFKYIYNMCILNFGALVIR